MTAQALKNPWILPPLPPGYDPPALRPRQVNRLLNLSLVCSVVFLTLVFPALLHRSLTGAQTVFGLRFVAVMGDSMEPALHAGALALAVKTPFERLSEGDVIVFAQADGSLATRRVVSLQPGGAVTKGDRSLLPDAAPVPRAMYRCRVVKVFNGFAPVLRALIE